MFRLLELKILPRDSKHIVICEQGQPASLKSKSTAGPLYGFLRKLLPVWKSVDSRVVGMYLCKSPMPPMYKAGLWNVLTLECAKRDMAHLTLKQITIFNQYKMG